MITPRWLVTLFCCCLFWLCHNIQPVHSQPREVYVSERYGFDDDPSCLYGGYRTPCKNLTYALESIARTKIAVKFHVEADDKYILETGISFINVNVVSMLAYRNDSGDVIGGGLVDIYCSEAGAGLSFIDSTDITIQNVSFHGCGVEHDSTTLNSDHTSFVLFNVALYFERCLNVQLQSVSITDSLGVAVQMYATVGFTNIVNCNFTNNPASNGSLGGGLLIEFPYCLPGNMTSCTDSESRVPSHTVSDSTYTISGCSFENNKAILASSSGEKFLVPFNRSFEAFGYGGGLSVIFRGSANHNSINIDSCQWHNNSALYGGGLYIKLQDSSYNNTVLITGFNVFTGNSAGKNGGGAMFSYLYLNACSVFNNTININGADFINNVAVDKGGGIYYLGTRQSFNREPNILEISNCNLKNNIAELGSAMDLSLFHPGRGDYMYQVVLTDCTFVSNVVSFYIKYINGGTILGAGALHVEDIPIVFQNSIQFINNTNQTALVVSGSKIGFGPNTYAVFDNNTGENGGAIALYASAYIEVNHNTSFVFTNNYARQRGGAIFSESFGTSIQKTSLNCMIRYYDITVSPNNWVTSFVFTNNSVNNNVNSSIYASTVHPCSLLDVKYENNLTEQVEYVFCWNNISINWEYDYEYNIESCMAHIQTDVSSFTYSGSSSRFLRVMPGSKTKLDLQPLNDQRKPVHNYILHAYPLYGDVSIDKDYYYFSSNNIILYKSTNTEGYSKATITVDTVQSNSVQIDIEIQFEPCNAGLELQPHDGNDDDDNGRYGCKCVYPSNSSYIVCEHDQPRARLLHGYWIGKYNNEYVIGHCLTCNHSVQNSTHTNNSTSYSHVTLNVPLSDIDALLCGNGSSGVLCSNCSDGYAPAIDYDKLNCVPCNDTVDPVGVTLFVVFDVVIPVIFLSAVYLFDVPLTSGLLHGPILICQMVSTVITLDAGDIIPYKEKIYSKSEYIEATYTALYNFFNLYFGRTLLQKHCLSKHINHYATIVAINYIPSLLPLVIVLLFAMVYYCSLCVGKCCITCIGFKAKPNFGLCAAKCPCCKEESCFRTAVRTVVEYIKNRKNQANFLATAILLSYTKLAVTTCYLLTPVLLYRPDDTSIRVMYLDGSILFGSHKHLPYLLLAVFLGGIFLIIVPLVLVLYRPNDPDINGGFFNHLLGQYQDEFYTKKRPENAPPLKETPDLDKAIHIGRYKLCEVRGEGKYSFWNPTSFFCKFRCGHHCNLFFNTNLSTHDFRWFAGASFVVRLLIVLAFAISWTPFIQFIFQAITCIVYAIIVMAFRPFNRKSVYRNSFLLKRFDPNFIEASSMMLLALMIILSMYQYHYTMTGNDLSKPAYILQVILAFIPIVWIGVAYCGLFYLQHESCLKKCFIFCCCSLRGGSQRRRMMGEGTPQRRRVEERTPQRRRAGEGTPLLVEMSVSGEAPVSAVRIDSGIQSSNA